jgi:hypothetical protein
MFGFGSDFDRTDVGPPDVCHVRQGDPTPYAGL